MIIMSKNMKAKNSGMTTWVKVVFWFSLVSVFGFFLATTLLMTMTGEDILHQNQTLARGSWGMMTDVYGFLPRVGEFLQRFVIQFYDYQTNALNDNVVWRIIDALLCFALICMATILALGGKLKVCLKDAFVFLMIFCMFILSSHNEIFMMRFSYLHNYIPILLSLTIVGYIIFYLKDKPKNKAWPILGLMAGILLGASNEIAPIAFLVMAMVYVAYKVIGEKISLGDIIKKSPTRSVLVLGVVVGLVFMLSSGAIASRGDSSYGDTYDYVSLFGVFGDTFYTIAKLLQHFVFNARYLWMPLLAVVAIIFTEIYLAKSRKVRNKPFVMIHVSLLSFTLLYLLASSQLSVLDDLYPRFMSPVFLAVVVSFMTFGSHLIDLLKPGPRQLSVALIIPVVIVCAAIVDVVYGFNNARQSYSNDLSIINSGQAADVCVVKYQAERQHHSPIFGFTSFSPFEEWTSDFGSGKIYGKQIIYASSCPN